MTGDAAALLGRALAEHAEAAGCPVRVSAAHSTRWASVTFTGARHRLTLAGAASPAIEDWLLGLPEAEFALRGHLVADVRVEAVRREEGTVTAELEVLTVEER